MIGFGRTAKNLLQESRMSYNPCRLWHLSDIFDVASACVILHRVIEDCRGYADTMQFRGWLDSNDQCASLKLQRITKTECRYDQADLWREYLDGFDTEEDYEALKHALVDNKWNMAGEC